MYIYIHVYYVCVYIYIYIYIYIYTYFVGRDFATEKVGRLDELGWIDDATAWMGIRSSMMSSITINITISSIIIVCSIIITIIISIIIITGPDESLCLGTTVPEDAILRGNHFSNTTCLTHAFSKSGEHCGKLK